MEDNNVVHKDVCTERVHAINDKIDSHKDRMDKIECTLNELTKLSIQLTEILKNQTQQTNDQNQRLVAVEKKPSTTLDKISGAIISAVISGLIAFIMIKFQIGA